jgi:hypothetical protein
VFLWVWLAARIDADPTTTLRRAANDATATEAWFAIALPMCRRQPGCRDWQFVRAARCCIRVEAPREARVRCRAAASMWVCDEVRRSTCGA